MHTIRILWIAYYLGSDERQHLVDLDSRVEDHSDSDKDIITKVQLTFLHATVSQRAHDHHSNPEKLPMGGKKGSMFGGNPKQLGLHVNEILEDHHLLLSGISSHALIDLFVDILKGSGSLTSGLPTRLVLTYMLTQRGQQHLIPTSHHAINNAGIIIMIITIMKMMKKCT